MRSDAAGEAADGYVRQTYRDTPGALADEELQRLEDAFKAGWAAAAEHTLEPLMAEARAEWGWPQPGEDNATPLARTEEDNKP
jgi:hypothetical protein